MDTDTLFTNLFFIGKRNEKFYVFEESLRGGRMEFSFHPEPFHTAEDAHLWLIDKAKELSTEKCKISCLEIQREYIYIRELIKPPIEEKPETN